MIDWKRQDAQRTSTRMALCLLGLSVLTVSGCLVGPDYSPPATPAPDAWHQQLENGTYAGREEVAQWWHLLADEKLNELIDCADDRNLDLYAAFTRIWQARAQLCIATSPLLGAIGGTGSYSNIRQSQNQIGFVGGGGAGPIPNLLLTRDNWALGLDLNWELNVWGRITRQIQSADATLCASVEDYRDVLVILYAEVASNYVQVRTLQQRLEYAQSNVKIQEDALRLATRRVEAGVAPSLDMHQAESNLAGTQAAIPPLQTQLHLALNRLAVLLGQYPGSVHEFLAAKAPIPPPPSNLPLSLPCDVIRQRPDIRRAERRIAAQTANLGVAISDLLPRFTLTGTFGLQSLQFSSLFETNSWGHIVGPAFSWPFFQNGRIKCNIANVEALVEEAIAVYQQTILLAAEEVENSLVSYRKELERLKSLRVAVKAAQNTLDDALDLYRAGKTNFQNVLDSLRTLTLAQDELSDQPGPGHATVDRHLSGVGRRLESKPPLR